MQAALGVFARVQARSFLEIKVMSTDIREVIASRMSRVTSLHQAFFQHAMSTFCYYESLEMLESMEMN